MKRASNPTASSQRLDPKPRAKARRAAAGKRSRAARPSTAKNRLPARSVVRAWSGELTLPTYLPAAPDRNPMFLEKRVYQGSSGRVYPLPFIDRIAEAPVPHRWQAVWIENEFLRALVLPEIGGRIHALLDKTNGCDLIYNQPVIKPALVGLAGPWISGGIEFNWPQHHRPATFMPVDWEIEEHSDGSKTIWCADHDPLCRMKARHGICLHPGRALLELKVRAHNRTPFVQTFLWWANVATRVHEAYQSFFPPDVYYVADHARRSMSEYPLAQGRYYGVPYGRRGVEGVPAGEAPRQYVPPHCHADHRRPQGAPTPPAYAANDLSFYANIPVPTSYMCMGSQEDFFGGYDHRAQAGIVHVANHHIAPGKKQWTWGNHEFGYAWDRNLTDADAAGEHAPYIEIMAGVYTDNQPDFSFLQPGETKSWSQHWYPIQQIGPAQQANLDAAVSLHFASKCFRVGVSVTRAFPKAVVRLERTAGPGATEWKADLAPGKPLILESPQPPVPWKTGRTLLRVLDNEGAEVIRHRPRPRTRGEVPPPATEPPSPEEIPSADELFVTGLHLDQYRHATRCPTLYWREALRRDPLDARCNNALGLWHLKRGEFGVAETHFRHAIDRLTRRNANPADGEPFYNLGLCLRHQAETRPAPLPDEAPLRKPARHLESRRRTLIEQAYAALYKATWNQAWAGPAFHALAEIDCCRRDWATAAQHIERSCNAMGDNPRALNLWGMIVREQGNFIAAEAFPKLNRAADPLDWWARHLDGEELTCDNQTLLDLVLDLARAGFHSEAAKLLTQRAGPATRRVRKRGGEQASSGGDSDPRNLGTEPLIHYYLGWLHTQLDHPKAARAAFKQAAAASPDYCFPARLEEIAILETAMRMNPNDPRAPYYLGNLLYDRRRHEEAIRLWERAARLDPGFPVAWRNLGIGHFNIRHDPAAARRAYDRACRAAPDDARLLYERDQLWKRLGEAPAKRLRALERLPDLIRQRDDLSVELAALYNQTGRPERALAVVATRRFQPWEGGEGGPLAQWVRAHLTLGRRALVANDAASAREHFEAALNAPPNLGEARHLLANQSDAHYWLGCALDALGDRRAARDHWRTAATFEGDFQEMSVRAFSEMTCFSALAWRRLGRATQARKLFEGLLAYALELETAPAKIDYFATSLPAMLLFDDDLPARQQTTARFLQAQAHFGLGDLAQANALLREVLHRDPNHPHAADLAARPIR